MLRVTNDFLAEIKAEQGKDKELQQIVGWLGIEKGKDYKIGTYGILRYRNRVCVS